MSYVMGITRSHDSGVCLLKDGEVRVAVPLERIARVKRCVVPIEVGLKTLAQAFEICFQSENISWGDIDRISIVSPDTRSDKEERDLWDITLPFVDKRLSYPMPHPSHHLAHAYASFYPSGFSEAAALVIDCYGSYMDQGTMREAESGYVFSREREPKIIFKNKKPSRIAGKPQQSGIWTVPDTIEGVGEIYRIITLLLGFFQDGIIFDDAGKTMGLAPYGTPFQKPGGMLQLTEDNVDYSQAFNFLLSRNLIRPHNGVNELLVRAKEVPLSQFHKDLAAQVQYEFEEACVHLCRRLHKETGLSRLVLGGGSFLNSVTNNRILEESGFSELYVFPGATDDGTSVGAAYYCYEAACRERGLKITAPALDHVYLGKKYTDETCLQAINDADLQYEEFPTPEDAAERAGKLLADGNILAWFQGSSEFGPRALGNRSILADPRGDSIKDTLNKRVKFREPFRPFAPAVLEHEASSYFQMPCSQSPYMLLVCPVQEQYRALLPGITHVDGTARVQTVNHKTNPTFARVIESFQEAAGIPIVLNTSFNLKGEPIVETPGDAVRCFTSTEMDYIVLGRYIARATDIAIMVPERKSINISTTATFTPDQQDIFPNSVKIGTIDNKREIAWGPEVLDILKSMDGDRNIAAIAKQLSIPMDELKPKLLALYRLGYFVWKKAIS
jgi:carbamoyltransferase